MVFQGELLEPKEPISGRAAEAPFDGDPTQVLSFFIAKSYHMSCSNQTSKLTDGILRRASCSSSFTD